MLNSLANIHSLNPLMNSLLREINNYEIRENYILLNFDKESFKLELEYESSLYLHRFTGKIVSIKEQAREISFEEFIKSLLKHFENDQQSTTQLEQRILESRDNIQNIIKEKELQYKKLMDQSSLSFLEAEQLLLLGHNAHPCPKSKAQFSEKDQRLYSPEYSNKFPLKWLLIKKDKLFKNSARNFQEKNWNENFFIKDLQQDIKSGYSPFPMHPWQFNIFKETELFKKYYDDETILVVDALHQNCHFGATSSLRSLYSENYDYMLKFSLSLQITNSIRHLQEVEVVRGMEVCDVMDTKHGRKFLEKNKNFKILNEPSYMAILDGKNKLRIDTIVLIRENIETQENIEQVVLSTINQPSIYQNKTFFDLRKVDKRKWFQLYLENILTPFLNAAMEFGILYGAHQQNIIVNLKNSYPESVTFRDCQGTGYTELGFEKMKDHVSSLKRENGNIVSYEMAKTLVGYYLFINSTFSTISALSTTDQELERELISTMITFLEDYQKKEFDTFLVDYFLENKSVKQKGNFLCCFQNINENTQSDPTKIYTKLKNPFFRNTNERSH
ncbi:IucA/IucC family protein [Halobacteriovorax sp. GB3]|uniref:IucA/IucC family protein n=1 Tax=Halobacteriovorax sp. GB3 TaxID=2719615 RepID=UPI00235FCA9C|nr:IucA/IucC family protein [Halobacteriovorax sp. GB3]MDD0851763.1 IucA/IucC family protein [Halobacteriovorax sp. GB3]